jgi:hypothetical protein
MSNLSEFDKISIVDLIIEYYPELKKDRTNIIKLVLQQITRPNKLILEKVIHEKKTYYKYNDGILIDDKLNTCGMIINGRIIIPHIGNRYEKHMKVLKDIENKFQYFL